MTNGTDPSLTESNLANSMSLRRQDVRKFRQQNLQYGDDYSIPPGKPVIYTQRGVDKLQNHFRSEDGTVILKEERDYSTGRVTGYVRNPKLIKIKVAGVDALCRTRDQRKWVIGMEVPIQPVKSPGGTFPLFRATREPRFKGKM